MPNKISLAVLAIALVFATLAAPIAKAQNSSTTKDKLALPDITATNTDARKAQTKALAESLSSAQRAQIRTVLTNNKPPNRSLDTKAIEQKKVDSAYVNSDASRRF
jgi:uncharacterized membrane protein YgcG